MHKLFQEALDRAEGRTEYIVVVLADIRGFSEFSSHRESPDIAMYIKRVYIRMIDDYFPGASFYKPTGDGMLITMHCSQTEESLRETARAAVAACLRCVDEFPRICEGDPMINFDVPTGIGFGVARGTACCLVSGDVILDYSGQLLNLASRLMHLARPRGVVLDGAFGLELLAPDQRELFGQAQVCMRGVAETEPTMVYAQAGVVEVPEEAAMPLTPERWQAKEEQLTLGEWQARVPRWAMQLDRPPRRPSALTVTVESPLFRHGRRVPETRYRWQLTTDEQFEYVLWGNRPIVLVHLEPVLAHLRQRRVTRAAEVKIIIQYVPC